MAKTRAVSRADKSQLMGMTLALEYCSIVDIVSYEVLQQELAITGRGCSTKSTDQTSVMPPSYDNFFFSLEKQMEPFLAAMSKQEAIPAEVSAATKRRAHIKRQLTAIEGELSPPSVEKMAEYVQKLELDLPRRKQECLALKRAQDLVSDKGACVLA